MRPAFLHLDDALSDQPALIERGLGCGGRTVEALAIGPSLRLWSRPPALDALRDQLRLCPYNAVDPDVFFCGSGDFHHVACLLIERALDANDAPCTIVHFDNHPDWVKFDNGMHCGSWVARAARLRNVHRVLSIGICSTDIGAARARQADLSIVEENRLELYPYAIADGSAVFTLCGHDWPTIEGMGEKAFVEFITGRIETTNVYITIDKDVLRVEDAITNWDQGRISLAFLDALLRSVSANHHLVGADITGDWSMPLYGGPPITQWLKRGESLLDQPWWRPSRQAARTVNERSNLRLFDFFAENLQ